MDELLENVSKRFVHPHVPQNVNEAVNEAPLNFNEWLAVTVTNGLGSMPCAYIFMVLAVLGFPGFNATPAALVQWVSQTCIQLVALSIIALGQTIQNRHTERRNDESYKMQVKTCHDAELTVTLLKEIKQELQQQKERNLDDGK